MPWFFDEQPFLLQIVPGLDRGVIIGVNRIGQVLVVAAAMMAIYQDSLLVSLRRWLVTVAAVIRKSAAAVGWRWTRGDIGFKFPPEAPVTNGKFSEDAEMGKQFLFSTIFLAAVLWLSGRGPLGWLAFPFEVACRAITVWTETQWRVGWLAAALGESLLRLLGFLPLLYFAVLACVIVTRPYAFLFSRAADRISAGHYRLAMLVVLLIGSLFVMVAT